MKTLTDWVRALVKRLLSIRYKIILPYALLTLVLAVFGVYVVTGLIATRLEERLQNQLIAAGRTVSDEVVNREERRLEVLRGIANTDGMAAALIDRQINQVNSLVVPLVENSGDMDSVILTDAQGREVLRMQRETLSPDAAYQINLSSNVDLSGQARVQQVLADPDGSLREVFLLRDANNNELIVYTVGAISGPDGTVGAVLVGTYLQHDIELFRTIALADVTIFDQGANVLGTTFNFTQEEIKQELSVFTPQDYQRVTNAADDITFLDEVAGRYRVGYAPFFLRERQFGVFAIALPTDFITQTNSLNRLQLSIIFAVGVFGVFAIGYVVSQVIIQPILQLVRTTQAVTEGDLDRRTNMNRRDEIGILASSFDAMTDQLQRLLRIQAEEATKLNAILDSIADGVVVLDQNQQILVANPAAKNILEAIGSEGKLPDFEQQMAENIQLPQEAESAKLLNSLTSLDFHETRRFELGGRFLSGLSAPVNIAGRPGAVVVLRDITREVESEKLKDDFIQSVSHELKTPMTAIIGYNSLLKMMVPMQVPVDKTMDIVTKMEKEAQDLNNVIQQMLDLSQIDAGNLGIDQEPVNLNEMLELELETWEEKMAEKELSFSYHLPDEPVWVEGDEDRLTRVVANLLKNAHDYTLAGGDVKVLLTAENGQAQIDIMDTGVGVSREDQRFLFKRFFRAIHEQSTFELSGAGLGLYISKAIVEAHNGEIWVKTELNKGSTFSVALPVVDPEDSLADMSMEYAET